MRKNKNIVKSMLFLAVSCVMGFVSSCDNIDDNERLIYIEPTLASRNVLIEDFTGQKCVNCPKAAEAIHEIQQVYGDTAVVAVAIHCGPFAFDGTSKYPIGLHTATGDEYWNNWFESTQGQPVAKINRGAATNDYGNWSNEVVAALQQTTDVQINATSTFDEASRKLDITTTTIATAGKKAMLQLWLTEDNIIAMQKDGANTLGDYQHNHVFRGAVNGTWGEEFTYTESLITFHHTYTLPADWDAKNVHIVAFVYNENGVEQVIQRPICK